jgi:hypothetical protein
VKKIRNFESFLTESKSLSEISQEMSEILNSCVNGTWELKDGKINIQGDFDGSRSEDFAKAPKILPFVFGKVSGTFDIGGLEITTLEGCPEEVGESFICSNNLLDDLKFGPKKAKRYYCSNNYLNSLDGISDDCEEISAAGNNISDLKALSNRDSISGVLMLYKNPLLKNLEGCPKTIGKGLDVSACGLESLEGCATEVGGDFICENNKLQSLEFGPKKVGGFYDCSNNKLESLEGSPKKVKWMDASNNLLISVEGAPVEFSSKKIFLKDNKLPRDLLDSQVEFLTSTNSEFSLQKWFVDLVSGGKLELRKSLIQFLNNKKFVGDKSTVIFELLDKVDLAKISRENSPALAYLSQNVERDSPLMDYILQNKSEFSDSFIDDLEMSSDLSDLGF